MLAADTMASVVTAAGTSRNGRCVVASTTRSGLFEPGDGRVAASIMATLRPVYVAIISVWPGNE